MLDTLESLKEYAKNQNLTEVRDFLERLILFSKENQSKMNLNDTMSFKQLIDDNKNLLNKEEAELAIDIADELNKNGFINANEFFKKHKEIYNIADESYSDLMSQLLEAQRKSMERKDLENEVEKLESENETEKKEIQKPLETNKVDDLEINDSQNIDAKQKNKAMVNAMLDYIKDEDSTIFPFAKEETLENKNFLQAFYKELNTFKNSDIEMLIQQVQRKNEALRGQIKELQDKKEALLKEVKENQELSQEVKEVEKNNNTENAIPKENVTPASKEVIKDSDDESLLSRLTKAEKEANDINEKHKENKANRQEANAKYWAIKKAQEAKKETTQDDEQENNKKSLAHKAH